MTGTVIIEFTVHSDGTNNVFCLKTRSNVYSMPSSASGWCLIGTPYMEVPWIPWCWGDARVHPGSRQKGGDALFIKNLKTVIKPVKIWPPFYSYPCADSSKHCWWLNPSTGMNTWSELSWQTVVVTVLGIMAKGWGGGKESSRWPDARFHEKVRSFSSRKYRRTLQEGTQHIEGHA